MNKVAPKISKPGSHRFPQKGPHNPNVGTSGSGMAPKPRQTPPDRPASHAPMHNLARVKNRPSSTSGPGNSAGSFNPLQNNAMANLQGQQIGQQEVMPRPGQRIAPQTQTPVVGNQVATRKPKTRAALAFYGE